MGRVVERVGNVWVLSQTGSDCRKESGVDSGSVGTGLDVPRGYRSSRTIVGDTDRDGSGPVPTDDKRTLP